MQRDDDPANAGLPASVSPPWARVTALCLLIVLGLWIARDFIAALVWGVVIAIAIDPLHVRLRSRWSGAARHVMLAALLTLAVALVVLAPLILGITQAAMELRQLAQWIASAKAHGIPVPTWVAHAPFGAQPISQWWAQHLATPEAATAQFHSLTGADLITHSRLIGTTILHRVVVFAFTLLALFFLLRDRDSILAQARRAGERLLGPASVRIGGQAILSVRGTIDGLILVGMGEGVAMTLVYLVLRVPHSLLLGLLTAVAATIPFGAAFLFGLAAVLLLAAGSVSGAVIVVVAGLVVVGIADHFIRPALIGGATRLPFLWVLIGILGGAETLGVLGLFVGPATMAILIMLWRDFVGNSSTA